MFMESPVFVKALARQIPAQMSPLAG